MTKGTRDRSLATAPNRSKANIGKMQIDFQSIAKASHRRGGILKSRAQAHLVSWLSAALVDAAVGALAAAAAAAATLALTFSRSKATGMLPRHKRRYLLCV